MPLRSATREKEQNEDATIHRQWNDCFSVVAIVYLFINSLSWAAFQLQNGKWTLDFSE
jgi:hypothetical protein